MRKKNQRFKREATNNGKIATSTALMTLVKNL